MALPVVWIGAGLVRDWIFRPNRGKRLVDWWAVDAWIDSSLYGVASKGRDLWSGYSNFISQFRVTGFRRFAFYKLSMLNLPGQMQDCPCTTVRIIGYA